MNFLYLWNALLRRKYLLIGIPILCAALAYGFMLLQPDRYRAVAEISTGFTTTEDQIQISDGQRFRSERELEIKFNNLLESMRSDLAISLMSYRLMLNELEGESRFRDVSDVEGYPLKPEAQDRADSLLRYKLENYEVLLSTNPDDRWLNEILRVYDFNVESLEEDIYIERVPYTDFIEITYVTNDPYLSSFGVNTYVSEFIQYYNSQKATRSTEEVTFFANLMERKKNERDQKTELLQEYKRQYRIVNSEVESESKVNQIASMEASRSTLQQQVNSLQLSLQSINDRLAGLNMGSGDDNQSRQRYLTLQEKIKRLNEQFILTGSSDQLLYDSLQRLRRMANEEYARTSTRRNREQAQQEMNRLLSEKESYETQLKIAETNLRQLNGRIAYLKSDASNLASQESYVDQLEKEVELAQNEYLDAQRKFNEVQNRSFMSSSSLEQVVFGQPSSSPVDKQTDYVVATAGAGSFILCFLFVLVRELVDIRIKTPSRFHALTAFSPSGVINKIDSHHLEFDKLFSENSASPNLERFKQEIRKLRYEIITSNAKVILVTSGQKKEGKSFLVQALAYSLSMMGKKVLVLDTNFKHNTLTLSMTVKPYLELAASGKKYNLKLLSNVNLNGEISDKLIAETKVQQVDIIGNSGGDLSPAEIFPDEKFKSLIQIVSGTYDYIFLEGSAMDVYSDTRELIPYADKVLPVFSAESVLRHADKETINFLKLLDHKLLNPVLNQVETENLEI